MSRSAKVETQPCEHTRLSFDVSRHASERGFTRPSENKRMAASMPSGRIAQPKSKKEKAATTNGEHTTQPAAPSPSTFPAPLVLPGDDIALDPRYPPQSLLSWIRSKDRNEVRPQRNTIYVIAASDDYSQTMQCVESWIHPQRWRQDKKSETLQESSVPSRPCIKDLIEYLSALYHGMPVKRLETDLKFTTWDGRKPDHHTAFVKHWNQRRPYIGLSTGSEIVRIQTRDPLYQPFAIQLNLNDLLDAAISMLPSDAYALLVLVHHDIYEDENDEFACGRAYGGSRVAIVSTARYNPCLDEIQKVERQHAWPAAHCAAYMKKVCADGNAFETGVATAVPKRKGKSGEPAAAGKANASGPWSQASSSPTPMEQALSAFKKSNLQPDNTYLLYLSRVCRTAAHELGHCFGIDHCMYYACAMQGTAGMMEDARQPPYVCPIDLEKLLRATGSTAKERYRALLSVCERWSEEGTFAAHAAWIRGALKEMEAGVEGENGDVVMLD